MIGLNIKTSTFQKLQVVAVPRESYGKFYDGDAYIIYSATPFGQPGSNHMKVGNMTFCRTASKLPGKDLI